LKEFIRELVKKIKPIKSPAASDDVQTAPLSDEQLQTVSIKEEKYFPIQIMVGSAQSVGRQRDHNEDAILFHSAVLSDAEREQPFGIFIVADGMGGHENGELASSIACRVMAEYLVNRLYYAFLGIDNEPPLDSIQEIMEQAVQKTQQAVLSMSKGGGTTLSAALLVGGQITVAHVGDSRIYFIYPDGRMQTITQDHSLVRKLVELGQITESEASVHPQRNVLYRAIGQSEPLQVEVITNPVPMNGHMLLCSDGLWGVVPENEMFKVISRAKNVSDATQQLIDAANAAGGPDNISALLVHFCH
jgi:protein phosphatase